MSEGTVEAALRLAEDLVAYSGLREKVRLREDQSEYEEAERLIARLDALRSRGSSDTRLVPSGDTTLLESEIIEAQQIRIDMLEQDRLEAWAAMETAVNWIQSVFGDDEVTVTEDEWLEMRNRLLNAGEFAHFMRAEEPPS